MDFVSIVSEDKIRKAIKEGDFENLPGLGKPQRLEDLSTIPENLRIAYKVMKNAGMLEETEIRKDLMSIEDLIEACQDEEERVVLTKRLNEKLLRLNQVMKKRNTSNSSVFKDYQSKIHDKF